MHTKLGTPDHLHAAVDFPDADTHVVACDLLSKSTDEVRAAEAFAGGYEGKAWFNWWIQ